MLLFVPFTLDEKRAIYSRGFCIILKDMIRGHCFLVEEMVDTCGDAQSMYRHLADIRFTASVRGVRSTGLLHGLTADGGVSEQ